MKVKHCIFLDAPTLVGTYPRPCSYITHNECTAVDAHKVKCAIDYGYLPIDELSMVTLVRIFIDSVILAKSRTGKSRFKSKSTEGSNDVKT